MAALGWLLNLGFAAGGAFVPPVVVPQPTGAAGNWNLNRANLKKRRGKTLRELQAEWKQLKEQAEEVKVTLPEITPPVIEFKSETDSGIAEILRQQEQQEFERYLEQVQQEILQAAEYLREQIILREDQEIIEIVTYLANKGLLH